MHPLKYAGESAADKIHRLLGKARENGCDAMLLTALDEIAWTLNLRGNDVECNPVFVSYLLIGEKKTTLYINEKKIDDETMSYLKTVGVGVDDYCNVAKGLKTYDGYNLLMDPAETSYSLYKAYGERPKVLVNSPVPAMKAVKKERPSRRLKDRPEKRAAMN